MTLNDLFKQLSHNELKNTFFGNGGAGYVNDEDKAMLISLVNDSLDALHVKFVLSIKDVLIQQYKHITNYHLIPRFSATVGNKNIEPFLYIRDTPGEVFQDEVLKIIKVYSQHGHELPLNQVDRRNSLFTPESKILQVPRPKEGEVLSVVYQSSFKRFCLEDEDLEISIPISLEAALKAHIAYLYFEGIGTEDSTMRANNHFQKYLRICNDSSLAGLNDTSFATASNKFHIRGFV